MTTNIRMKNPVHPGEFIKTEIIGPLGLSVTDAAHELDVPRRALSAFLNGKENLSHNMAIKIHKKFGVSLETLVRMQDSFDKEKQTEEEYFND